MQKVPAKTPVLLDYQLMIDNDSMYNTPPAYAIYVLGLVLELSLIHIYGVLQGGIAVFILEDKNLFI